MMVENSSKQIGADTGKMYRYTHSQHIFETADMGNEPVLTQGTRSR